jgi:hypothetical protein
LVPSLSGFPEIRISRTKWRSKALNPENGDLSAYGRGHQAGRSPAIGGTPESQEGLKPFGSEKQR